MSEEQVVLPTELRPREIVIAEKAQEEIKRLHASLVATAKAFETARQTFGEYIRVLRQSQKVPDNGRWEIKADASAFIELPEGSTNANS